MKGRTRDEHATKPGLPSPGARTAPAAGEEFKVTVPRSAVRDAVADSLRRMIALGHLRPGDRLRQGQLAEQLGVSRMPVRDAINDLVQEGLARPREGGGAMVVPLDASDVQAIYGLRGCIEKYAASLAAEHATEAQLDALASIIDRFRALDDPQPAVLAALDREFHTGVYECSGNPFVAAVVGPLWSQITRVMIALVSDMARYHVRAWEEHAELLEALRRRDASAAADLIDRHLSAAVAELAAGAARTHDLATGSRSR
ncbi:MAG: hypothetical protein QOI62_3043 [Solirubrobacteraceae bacterium]|jgi:DNA-binding GntR family transcriptional regulator|nr:hypothetical protein [Solirubrobacteraceae bacterium]MEA2359783.1 hypothetical protein [Solirubrobacteraceae bacterium]